MRSTGVNFPRGITVVVSIATVLVLQYVTAFAPSGSRITSLPLCGGVGLKLTVAPVQQQQQQQNGSETKNKQSPTKKGKARNYTVRKGQGGPSVNNRQKPAKTSTSTTRQFKALEELKLGSTISGKIIDVCDFGAFISTEYATSGNRAGAALLHVSQISDHRIDNIHDVLVKGQIITHARVISIDVAKGEVGLSMRTRRQYLDHRRWRQRSKRLYGTPVEGRKRNDENGDTAESQLEYFDKAIRKLEDTFREKE